MSILTNEEMVLIRVCWNLVKQDLNKHAVNFYISMFVNYPEWQEKFFIRLQGKSIRELRSSPILTAHASHVFHVISNLVENLEDTEVVVEGVKKVARTHWPLNIRMPELDAGIQLLVNYMKETLKDQLTRETEEAWAKLFGVMSKVLLMEQNRLDEEGYDLGGWIFKAGGNNDDNYNLYEDHTHIKLPSFDDDKQDKKSCSIM